MRPTERPRRHGAARRGNVVSDTALRAVLFVTVIAVGSALFALALLPAVGTAANAVQRIAEDFQRIGSDIDLQFPRIPERSTIYAADGTMLATLYLDENREYMRLRRVSDITLDAVIAIEDSRFYEHPGLDLAGIVRALVANLASGEIEQGASTITQQLARNVYEEIGTEQTLVRKIEEAKVAVRLEDEYSKDEILELYLNDVYFGRGVYGIGTAAEFYFGKNPSRLTLPEGALLAGLIAAPETYSPVNDRKAALARRNVVIERMRLLSMISDEEAGRAAGSGLGLDITDVGNRQARFPYFVQYLKHQILRDPRFGETDRARERALFQGGLDIHTTLQPKLQASGENVVQQRLPDPSDPSAAIAAVEAETGAILALVGGEDFRESQVNLATGQGGTGRQAGSAFKPFTLAAALEEGFDVGRVYDGASGQVVDCGEYGGRYPVFNAESGSPGQMNLLSATANSVNAVFVQLADDIGPPKIVDVAHRMGIESELEPVCSLTLGTMEVTPLEMASAFTTLANHGVHCEPYTITEVFTRAGKELPGFQRAGRCEQVIEREIADKVAGILRLVVSEGTGTAANLGTWPVFGKTGTSNDSADLWFDGCTRQICAATWVGHERGRIAIPGQYGGTIAAPIWHDFMLVAMRGLPALGLPDVPEPKNLRVPDVIGLPEDEAIKVLEEANFLSAVREVPSEEPKGIVVAQSPSGGSRVRAGSEVTIEVSSGEPPAISVPNVVGLFHEDARRELRAAGFQVEAVSEPTEQRSQDGLVAAQSPGSGSDLEEGQTVTIVVYAYEPPPPGNDGGGNGGGGGGMGGGGMGGGGGGNGGGGKGGRGTA